MTEDHPEVKAMVLSALEEAKQLSTSPLSLYIEALENHIKQVCQIYKTWQLHLHKDSYSTVKKKVCVNIQDTNHTFSNLNANLEENPIACNRCAVITLNTHSYHQFTFLSFNKYDVSVKLISLLILQFRYSTKNKVDVTD